ncbi:hypothetical protein DFQ30_006010 [Apophysomyces sp. BC1015]|nr:hypothetical protein DFQ30_006010 [Apophysomyces sp. BC1015]
MDIVNEITTIENEDEDIMNDIEEEEKDEDADDENPFVILGLSTCKVCIWKAMGDYVIDEVRHKDDLCLVVMVASHFSDILIQKRMQLLRESLNASHISTSDATTEQIGEHLVLLVQYWFNRAEDQEDI